MPKKVLVVDDSSTSRVMHGYLVTKHTNYEIVCAADGLQALDVAFSEHPDLILMDVQMPQLDGIEACRRLRENPRTQSIPVILLTSRRTRIQRHLG